MVGDDNRDPDDSPQARVDKIFDLMDEVRSAAQLFAPIDKPEMISAKSGLIKFQDGNGELTKEEFMEGAAMDDSIVGALSMYQNLI